MTLLMSRFLSGELTNSYAVGSYSSSSTSASARSTRSLKMIRPTVVSTWCSTPRRRDVVRRQHQDAGLGLRLRRQRQVDCHLVAVEVGVEGMAHQRVHLDRLALHEHGLERLETQAVERRRAVEQHGVLLDDLLEHVPDLRDHRVDHLLGRLDVLDGLALDEPGHDERLEQLEGHQLRQAALVELEARARHDDRAARVVDALAEQVLAEAALLALEHVAQRLQRTV